MNRTLHTSIAVLWQLRLQIGIALVFGLLSYLASIRLIPNPEELVGTLSDLFAEHGLILIVACALLENIVGVNIYFPGSVVLIAAMAGTRGDAHRAIAVYFAILLPAVIAQQINYAIVRLGFLAKRQALGIQNGSAEIPRTRRIIWWFVVTYWHPHLAAVTSVVAGQTKMPYGRFVACFLLVSLPWSVVWGFVLFLAGSRFPSPREWLIAFYVYLVGWMFWDTFKFFRSRRVAPNGKLA